MLRITMPMISKRSSDIVVECRLEPKYCTMYEHLIKSYRYEDAKNILMNWNKLGADPAVCAHRSIALYEYCIEQENSSSHITTLGNIITENILRKFRDGGQTRDYIKNRISRFKTKLHTKFETKNTQMKTAASDSIEGFNAAIRKATDAGIKSAVPKQPNNKQDTTKENAVLESFEKMELVLDEMCVCDTILNNQKKLSNRFNFDNIVAESVDLEDCVDSLCEAIDTYRMGLRHKYNVALQNIPYTLYRNGIKYDPSAVAEMVTDYFLFSSDSPDISVMKTVLEHNLAFLYEEKDVDKLSYMFKDIAKLDIKFDDTMRLLHEVDSKIIDKAIKDTKGKITDMINDFKKGAEKTPEKLRSLITKIYTQPADQIISEYPNILGIIRQSCIFIGLGSMNPILALVGLSVDYAIKLHLNRKQIDKYIEKHKKEIDKVKKKIEGAKSEEQKEKLTKYKDSLDKGLEKLKDYRDKLYTEDEAEKIRDKESEEEFDDEDIFGDFNFDESAAIIISIGDLVNQYSKVLNTDKLIASLRENINNISASDIDSITTYFHEYTDIDAWNEYVDEFIRLAYYDIINEATAWKSNISPAEYYDRLDAYKSIINTSKSLDPENKSLQECHKDLQLRADGYMIIAEFLSAFDSGILTEGSIKETLKLASVNLKNAIRNLGDKEKALSRTIDSSMNTFARGVETSLRNDNKEAVLRGSVIPSASKVIKTAIVAGAAWAVDPALAVIGALGAMAMGKQIQAKERQLLLDEIEIELKMTEKYLRIAEENNDMKATKQLLRTQRELQRQQQRIKYRMKVYHNQTTKVGANKDSYDDED